MTSTLNPTSENMEKSDNIASTNRSGNAGRKPGKRRAEIITLARKLFAKKGFHNVTFDDIAKEIGIKREGLYYYFKTPSDILFEIVEPSMKQLVERLELISGSELHPTSKLFLAIESHTKIFDRIALDAINLCASNVFDNKYGHLHAAFRPLYKRYEMLWLDIITQGEPQDSFNAIGNPKIVVFAVLGMCNWMVRWFSANGEADLDEVARTFFGVASYGLLGRLNGDRPDFDAILHQHLEEIRAFQLVHGTPQ